MRALILIFLMQILLTTTAFAQGVAVLDAEVLTTPGYFVVILSGVLLAFGFQFLLTALSVATGVTAVGDVKETYVEHKYRNEGDQNNDKDDSNKYDAEPGTPTGVKITTALGAWNVITASISLFVAAWLALKLVPIAYDLTYLTLALVIWATFFMLMFYLEGRLVGTLLGSLINTAVAGLKASGNAIANLFSPSPKSAAQDVADSTIEKLRKEFSADFDTDAIVNTLDRFVNKMDKKIPDYETLKRDLEEIVEKSAGKSSGNNSATKWMAIQSVIQSAIQANEKKGTEQSRRKVSDLQRLLADVKNAYQRGETTEEGVRNAVAASPLNEEKVNPYIDKIKDVLQRSSFNGDNGRTLREQIEAIVSDPRASATNLRRKLQEIDRDTIVELLDKNTSLEREKIDQYADRVENVLSTVTEKLGVTNDDPNTENLFRQFENKVRRFIDSTDAPELDYEALKNDFRRAMNNPNESLPIIKRRLSTFDRNTVIAVLTNTPWLDRSDIDRLADTIESAKEEVSAQITKIETQARSTMANVQRRAVIEAEHLRKTTASAAWWLVAAIVVSGVAAALGGLINA